MKYLQAGLFLTVMMSLALVGSANAVPITYNFQFTAPNGTPVTDLLLYATDGSEYDVYLPSDELPVSGASRLTHTVDFTPTEALVLGISKRTGVEKWDIVMFTTYDFVTDNLGTRFGDLFPNDRNPRHGEVPALLQGAHGGDAGSLSNITEFVRGADAMAAYFDPFGPYAIIQFTPVGPPNGGNIPTPTTLALIALGLLGGSYARKRRAH